MTDIGDNSVLNSDARTRLKSYVERVMRLEEDKAAVQADIGEVYAEVKGEGFDVKIVRKTVKHLREIEKVGKSKLEEEAALFDMYLHAVTGELFAAA